MERLQNTWTLTLWCFIMLLWGLTITQNCICTISDLDRSRLSDTWSAENDLIGADTDPEYRIDASIVVKYEAQLTLSNQAAFWWSPWRTCETNLNPWIYMRTFFTQMWNTWSFEMILPLKNCKTTVNVMHPLPVKPVTTLLHIRLLLKQHQFHNCTCQVTKLVH